MIERNVYLQIQTVIVSLFLCGDMLTQDTQQIKTSR